MQDNGLRRAIAAADREGPSAPARGRQRPLAGLIEPLAIFAVTRGCLVILAYLATVLFPKEGNAARQFSFGGLIDPWNRWDAVWYTFIADRGYLADKGYRFDAGDPASNIAFFPLYPLLIRAVSPLSGDTALAGWIVANLSLALALIVFYQLIAWRLDRTVARRAALLLSCFPYALFFGAIYTEALFLLLAVAAFWLAERRHWWLAGLAAGLCSATRLAGVTLTPALGLLYLGQRGYEPRKVRPDVLALGLMPLGLLSFMLYQYAAFGEPLAMVKASMAWPGTSAWAGGLGQLDPRGFGPPSFRLVLALNLAVALLSLAAVVPVGRLLGPGYAVFVLLALLIPLSQRTESLGRYVSVLFPVFAIAAYYVRGRVAFNALLCGSTLLMALLTILFANGYWVI